MQREHTNKNKHLQGLSKLLRVHLSLKFTIIKS